jgi:hypothetical protein
MFLEFAIETTTGFVFDDQIYEFTLVFGVRQYCFNLNFEVYRVFRHFNPALNIIKHL